MKRITKRDEFGNADINDVDMGFMLGLKFDDMVLLTKAFNRLADYEDKDKSGEWVPISCASVYGGSTAMWGSSIAGYMCSECYEEVESDTNYQYCPYCGASMSDYYCEVID